MKQTVVEWLVKEIPNTHWEDAYWADLYEQAKELEKEQLQKVWKAAEQNMRSQFSSSAYKNITFDEYYEALGSKKY